MNIPAYAWVLANDNSRSKNVSPLSSMFGRSPHAAGRTARGYDDTANQTVVNRASHRCSNATGE